MAPRNDPARSRAVAPLRLVTWTNRPYPPLCRPNKGGLRIGFNSDPDAQYSRPTQDTALFRFYSGPCDPDEYAACDGWAQTCMRICVRVWPHSRNDPITCVGAPVSILTMQRAKCSSRSSIVPRPAPVTNNNAGRDSEPSQGGRALTGVAEREGVRGADHV